MKVNGINKIYSGAERYGSDMSMDSKSKEVQNQIANARNRLKELAADKGLNEEEKEKKRQEIQQKLTELNNELKQRQMEVQREQQERKKEAFRTAEEEADRKDAKLSEEKLPDMGISQGGMKAMLSADASVRHAQTHGHMAMALEGRVRILQGEIKQDAERGKDTSQKKKELQKLESKAARMKGAKINFLTDASEELKEAFRKERPAENGQKKSGKDGVVRQMKSPFHMASKNKTDSYVKGNMFSNVEFHF